jgi:HPt (histidine-containing phosphotransfer) domain-containing protein
VEALATISGLDVEGGLKRVMGKRDFYARLVRGFAEGEEARATEVIRQLLADGDREAAERTAHSLKGVAGTIGAGELQARAQAVEAEIRDEAPDLEMRLESMDEELTRVAGAVRQAFGTPSMSDAEVVTEIGPLGDDVLARLPGLIQTLEGKRDTATELAGTMTIDEIEGFAAEMRRLGEESGYTPLARWAGKLGEAAAGFDMDGMAGGLGGFASLIDEARERQAS